MEMINWGIIGCGDVTELKSGPAFNKVPRSKLVAVMRRNSEKAKDYAERHGVPKWYNKADQLINDPDVNAVYIATPPDSHEQYALQTIAAGKPVYIEKPMALNREQAEHIAREAAAKNTRVSVAHYRRAQPYFKKIKSLLEEKAIGDVRLARLAFFNKPVSKEALANPQIAWRLNPAVSGGGLFHDLAPHQVDLMYHFFGEAMKVQGISTNQSGIYAADDAVCSNFLFKSGILFEGMWNFNVAEDQGVDSCEIIGTKGKIVFSFFGKQYIHITRDGLESIIPFEPPMHVQQPMIEEVTNYFLGEAGNPCSAEQGAVVMGLLDEMTRKH